MYSGYLSSISNYFLTVSSLFKSFLKSKLTDSKCPEQYHDMEGSYHFKISILNNTESSNKKKMLHVYVMITCNVLMMMMSHMHRQHTQWLITSNQRFCQPRVHCHKVWNPLLLHEIYNSITIFQSNSSQKEELLRMQRFLNK